MLVLSRHRDETIMIGDDIELTVVDIKGDKVRIGIKAPTRIAVHRKEVYDAIKRENERAASIKRPELDCARPPRASSHGLGTTATRLGGRNEKHSA
jgi:carbon storage regulator